MIEEGTILQKRYRIDKQIGQGGMGAVYLATDERFNSTVAIKETLFTDDNFIKAFKREGRLLNSLKHVALPKVTDHFCEEKAQYIVMEYIEGDDLFELMEQKGKAYPIDDVLNWAKQLLDALDYLHNQENPVIHRDIKPQNLKLTPDGQIILLDFGLAKGNPTDANHQTAANSIFGYSRNYASLEQMQGTGTDPRSDIYSLAATLYHLMTGKQPADALTRVMNVMNEDKDPLEPANKVYDQIPEDVSNVLDNAMSLNANLRPQSATEMRQMLFEGLKTTSIRNRETVSEKALETDILSRDTKVMGAAVQSNGGKKSEMKTAILSDENIAQESIQTKLASHGTNANKQGETDNEEIISPASSNRKSLVAAASAGLLLLGGSVLAGVYVFNPQALGYASPDNKVEVKTEKKVANSSIGNSNIEIVDTNSSTTDEKMNTTDEKVETTEKAPIKSDKKTITKTDLQKTNNKDKNVIKKPSNETAKVKKPQLETKDTKAKNKDGKFVTKDGTIITKDRIITKDGTIIDAKTGRIIVKGPKTKAKTLYFRDKYNKMSEEEKRKFREDLKKKALERERRKRRMRRPPFPPRPTP